MPSVGEDRKDHHGYRAQQREVGGLCAPPLENEDPEGPRPADRHDRRDPHDQHERGAQPFEDQRHRERELDAEHQLARGLMPMPLPASSDAAVDRRDAEVGVAHDGEQRVERERDERRQGADRGQAERSERGDQQPEQRERRAPSAPGRRRARRCRARVGCAPPTHQREFRSRVAMATPERASVTWPATSGQNMSARAWYSRASEVSWSPPTAKASAASPSPDASEANASRRASPAANPGTTAPPRGPAAPTHRRPARRGRRLGIGGERGRRVPGRE